MHPGQLQRADDGFVTATSSGGTVSLRSVADGSADDWQLSESVTYDSADFSSPSFTASGTSMSGGTNSSGALYSYFMPAAGGYDKDGNLLSVVDSVIGQWNYSYDAFGNINKTVPGGSTGTNYTAAYSSVTNQVSSGISPMPNYDANGNQLTSTGAQLTWNAAAQPITVNGTAANYDALGRMVETGASAVPSVIYDSGTLTLGITIGYFNCSVTVSYGENSVPSSLATALSSGLNNSSSCMLADFGVTVSAAGSVVTFTGCPGPRCNYTYTFQTSNTHNSQFSSASFALTASPSTISGGASSSLSLSGAEQSIITIPSCTGCKQFFYRPDGTPLGIYAGALVKETIPLPGGETAVYNGSGLNFIRHTDWLGSSRLATTWAHAVYSKEAYAPFGKTYNEVGTADRSFTSQDQDVATGSGGAGTYDFLFRKYDPSAGRWLSPDPYGWGAVDQTTPQSLNRYAYVENQPINATDPVGLILCVSGGSSIDSQSDSCPQGWSPFQDYETIVVNGGDGPSVPTPPPTQYDCSLDPNCSSALSPAGLGTLNVSGAPNNGPTWKQKNQNCLNTINNTPDGKLYNTFSYTSALIGPDASVLAAEQDAASEGAQRGALGFLKATAKNWGSTALGSGSGFAANVWEAVDGFALTPLAVAATAGQLTVHAGCAISAAF